MRKLFSKMTLVMLLIASMLLVACSSEPASGSGDEGAGDSSSSSSEESSSSEAEETGFTIEYPADMQELGFTEPLVLDEEPGNVVLLARYIDLFLEQLGADIIGYTTSAIVDYPEGHLADATEIPTFADDFNMETVVVMEPGLVIMGHTNKDTYGQICEDAGIPVYYVYSGHDTSFESLEIQTAALTAAFAEDDAAYDMIMDPFADLAARLEEVRPTYEGKTIMVLQSRPPSHYILSPQGTLASMLDMIGFENVYDGADGGMAPLNFETAIGYEPDYMFVTTMGSTAEESQQIMEADYANNQAYWDTYEALQNGNVTYLPSTYASQSGIYTIDRINELIDIIEAQYDM